jgi:hypothetical protein
METTINSPVRGDVRCALASAGIERVPPTSPSSNGDDCNITRKPPKLQPQRSQSLRTNTARIAPKHLKTDEEF